MENREIMELFPCVSIEMSALGSSAIVPEFIAKLKPKARIIDVYKRQIQVSEDARRMMKNCEAFMTERLVEFIEELGEEDANAFVRILEKALAYSQKRKEKLEEGEQK